MTDDKGNAREEGAAKAPGSADEEESGVKRIRETQEAVYCLLKYAISRADLDVKSAFLNVTIPVLQKKPVTFTAEDEATLWSGYNELSKLVAPATSESLDIADEIAEERLQQEAWTGRSKKPTWPRAAKCKRELSRIRYWMIAILIVFVIIQGYTLLLMRAVKGSENIPSEYQTLQELNRNLNSAPSPASPASPPFPSASLTKPIEKQAEPSKKPTEAPSTNSGSLAHTYLTEKRDTLNARILTATTMQYDLVSPFSKICRVFPCLPDIRPTDKDRLIQMETFMLVNTIAKSILEVLSGHVLPFILGFLGAVVYIARSSLSKLDKNSYMPVYNGRVAMRLCLGGLLGVITGVMFSPTQQELASLKLNLVFIAFLMGYSVELAFSLFDIAIEKIRNMFKAERKSLEGIA